MREITGSGQTSGSVRVNTKPTIWGWLKFHLSMVYWVYQMEILEIFRAGHIGPDCGLGPGPAASALGDRVAGMQLSLVAGRWFP
jgi:hypothetical protein